MGVALSGDRVSTTGERFLSPGELCDRWNIDERTLNKFDLPWVWFTPRIRRLSVTVVARIEDEKGLVSRGE